MRKVKVDDLVGNEILALPIVSDNDIVLIHADIVLTSDLITRIRNIGLYEIYIRDDKVEEEKVDILPKSNVPEHIYKVEETMEDSKVVVKAVLENIYISTIKICGKLGKKQKK